MQHKRDRGAASEAEGCRTDVSTHTPELSPSDAAAAAAHAFSSLAPQLAAAALGAAPAAAFGAAAAVAAPAAAVAPQPGVAATGLVPQPAAAAVVAAADDEHVQLELSPQPP